MPRPREQILDRAVTQGGGPAEQVAVERSIRPDAAFACRTAGAVEQEVDLFPRQEKFLGVHPGVESQVVRGSPEPAVHTPVPFSAADG